MSWATQIPLVYNSKDILTTKYNKTIEYYIYLRAFSLTMQIFYVIRVSLIWGKIGEKNLTVKNYLGNQYKVVML